MYVTPELPSGAGEKVTSLTAAAGKQIASWDAEARHGLFTHHLLDALWGKGDTDKDGKVTAKEAKAYLDRWMTRAARRMHRRIQEASLLGSEEVVLTTALAGGTYPTRPALGGGKGAAETVAKAGTASRRSGETAGASPSGRTARAPESPVPSIPRKRGTGGAKGPGPDHATVEAGLGLKRGDRALVQKGLAAMKYKVGYADGLFGKRTRGAIKAWQDAKGFKATGYLTKEQAEALKAVGEEVKVAVGLPAKPKPAKKRWQPGETFRDCEGCPQMVVLPAGAFMMGSPGWEKERDDNEGPRHQVTIPQPFAVGKYEVTFGEWDACVAEGGCGGYRPPDTGWGRGRQPVVNVSWEDAKAYVGWLKRKTGKEYRLLSEAEWEYAARAGTTGPFHYGGTTISMDKANYDGSYTYGSGVKGLYRKRTVPVGSFKPNWFGLHDVHGNVWEWVVDCWHGDYEGAPVDGSAWSSGGDCGKRVLRGGSWFDLPRFLRSANRLRNSSGLRYYHYGFRIARTLTP